MNVHHLLHPRAPLVFGTGKPMDFGVGGDTLRFPMPSTVAGALRAAFAAAAGKVPDAFAAECAATRFGPPLLMRVPADGSAGTVLLPRPADAAYVGGTVVPLVPREDAIDGVTDTDAGLLPLALQTPTRAKADEAPAWWNAHALAAWLAQRAPAAPGDTAPALPLATRTHVTIDPDTGAASDGGLFRSGGIEFGPQPWGAGGGAFHALAVSTDGSTGLVQAHRRLGGEGRPVRIEPFQPPAQWPCAVPPGIVQAKRIRLVLISPAVFAAGGSMPDGFTADGSGYTGTVADVRLRIYACALERAAGYSGWRPGGPGRAWRAVPAGTVYWCEVLEGNPESLWNRSLCQPEWSADGWGHALVGLA
jgi:CRISPR-associated protein Cmr3